MKGVRGDSAANFDSDLASVSSGRRSNQSNKISIGPKDVAIEIADPFASCTDPDFIRLMQVASEDISTWEKACSGDNIIVYKKAT